MTVSAPTIYDLAGGARLPAPHRTPLRNRIPRVPTTLGPGKTIRHDMLIGDPTHRLDRLTFVVPATLQAVSWVWPIPFSDLLGATDRDRELAEAHQTAGALRALMVAEEQHILLSQGSGMHVSEDAWGADRYALGTRTADGPVWSEPYPFVPGGAPRYHGILSQLAMPHAGALHHVLQEGETWSTAIADLAGDMAEQYGLAPNVVFVGNAQSSAITDELLDGQVGVPPIPAADEASTWRVTRLDVPELLRRVPRHDGDRVRMTPLDIVVQPIMPEGIVLLAAETLSPTYQRTMARLNFGLHQPWSIAVVREYQQETYAKVETVGAYYAEANLISALRIHVPAAFGVLYRPTPHQG